MRGFTKSFYDWCIENERDEWIGLWDEELNGCSPKDIGYGTKKEYYFKCARGLHESEQKMIRNLTSGNTEFKCNCCNSFEQWCINNNKTQWLDLWDYEKNGGCSPKDVTCASPKTYYFKCPRGLHESEQKRIADLINGKTSIKCSCCNSIGQYLIDNYGKNGVQKYWDCNKNKNLDPFKIPKTCSKKVWIKCQENEEHDSYFVSCFNFTLHGVRCSICRKSHGERRIREYLTKNNIEFTPQKTFPNLLGIGNKPLTFDFYIPHKNLLIEFQGIQHYEPRDFGSKDMKKAETKFENQQEHDRRKKDYSQQNNIDLLEITYIEEDKIEEILDGIFNKNI